MGGALHQLHYEFSTNLGLCQSNMTFLVKRKGSSYHWARDLFAKMGLPEVDGLYDIVTKENVERMRRLERENGQGKKTAGYLQTEAATGTAKEALFLHP